VASPSSWDLIRIPRPAIVHNLRKAMCLGDDDGKYPAFRVSFFSL